MPGSFDGRPLGDAEAAGTASRPMQHEVHETRFRCRSIGELALYDERGPTNPLIGAGKPTAILVYLALSADGRRGRDHVAELLWRSSTIEDARHSLRQALYRLRAATDGAELIASDNGDLVLSKAVWFDCLSGEEALADGDVESAYRLLHGEFMRGFSVPDSQEFGTWAETQGSRFSTGWTRAAFQLARVRLREGDPESALEPAERLLALNPYDENAVRLLMSAFAGGGRHAAALARYEAFADFVRAEDETEPSEDLRAYRDELRDFLESRGDAA
ncbi:MAG: BTAD domain-containing putative transcriptional regulator, partial [Acidobacteriota bacterium]|nr:BTAD domain-containing putative transcriptional regulator [Acidobacteriota bacterium]